MMTEDWRVAVENGDSARVRRLIDAGADINAKDRYGQTALMIAAVRGYTEIVDLLVQNGADLNHTAKHRLSALMLSVINNHHDIVRILVHGGADLEIRGTGSPGFHGKTASQLAAESSREHILAIFDESPRK